MAFFSVKQRGLAGATIADRARTGLDTEMMKRIRAYGALLAMALALYACGSSGEECDRCSSDNDCSGGLVCSTFDDGSTRCGTGTGTTCRVR